MRDSECDEVRRALVDPSPEQPARERDGREPRVRQVQHGEDERDEQNALPTPPENDLRATVDEALQRVLLQRPPEQTERGHAEKRLPAFPTRQIKFRRVEADADENDYEGEHRQG